MEITGTITTVLPLQSGTSRSGNQWQKASYVLETHEQYPKHVCFDVFGSERIQQLNIQQGEELNVSIDINAHEYNGKWFNSVTAYNVARVGQQPAAQLAAQQRAPQQAVAQPQPQQQQYAPQPAPQQQQYVPQNTAKDGGEPLPF